MTSRNEYLITMWSSISIILKAILAPILAIAALNSFICIFIRDFINNLNIWTWVKDVLKAFVFIGFAISEPILISILAIYEFVNKAKYYEAI